MYKIGTRVKKVRGKQLGITGVVCNGPDCVGNYLSSHNDMFVRMDGPWEAWSDSSTVSTPRRAGQVGQTLSAYWEPIIPDGSDVPAEVSLNKLLDPSFYEQAESLHAPA